MSITQQLIAARAMISGSKAAAIALSIILVSCVKAAFLPTDTSQVFEPTDLVAVFWSEPDRPYVVIGRVSVEAGSGYQERIFASLKERAREAGAQAIIMLENEGSIVGVPTAQGGTLIAGRLRLQALAIRFIEEE